MKDSPHSKLSADDALHLYQRLLERDPVAPADFALAFLKPLIACLRHSNPRIDPMACEEAADEAIVRFLLNPSKYDPQRLGVEAFLRMAAQRDLQNLLRKERRHHNNRRNWNVVEHTSEEGKYLQRNEDPSLPLQIEEARQRQVAADSGGPEKTEAEQRVWEQMQQGERRHSVFADILGVTHLPLGEQKRHVKRVKDRLKKRKERAGGNYGRSP